MGRTRAHSSVVEHSPYKRGVAGSNPAAPTRQNSISCPTYWRACVPRLCTTVDMRRDNGAGSVYFDHKSGTTCRDEHYHKGCTGRWSASISMGRDGNGKRSRARLVAPTKTELLRKVSEAQAAIETGLEVSGHYTVSDALDTFLAVGLEGLAPRTVQLQEFNVKLLKAPTLAHTGSATRAPPRSATASWPSPGTTPPGRSRCARTPWSARSGWPRPRSASAQCRRGRQDASGPEDRPGPPGVQPGADAGDPGSPVGVRNMDAHIHLSLLTRQPGRGPGPALGSDRRPGQ